MQIGQVQVRVVVHEEDKLRPDPALVALGEPEGGHALEGDAVVVLLDVDGDDVAVLLGLLGQLVEDADPGGGAGGLAHEEEDADLGVGLGETHPGLSRKKTDDMIF